MASARVFLNGANVDREFREELFDAANRAGMAPGEFALIAVAEKLTRMGRTFPGVFRKGDFHPANSRSEAA